MERGFVRTSLQGGATCATFHNKQCHAPMRDHSELHTHHAAASEASRCVSATCRGTMDALLFCARSHQIDEIPDARMTARFGESASPIAR